MKEYRAWLDFQEVTGQAEMRTTNVAEAEEVGNTTNAGKKCGDDKGGINIHIQRQAPTPADQGKGVSARSEHTAEIGKTYGLSMKLNFCKWENNRESDILGNRIASKSISQPKKKKKNGTRDEGKEGNST